MNDVIRTGPAVVLDGKWLAVAQQALYYAIMARRRSGYPDSREFAGLLDAITTALSRSGQSDMVLDVDPRKLEVEGLTTAEAAKILCRSPRSVQRMAGRLGGRMVGGRWFLDRRAVEEHLEGRTEHG